ncbi:zinc finger protein 335-like [Branchiostoma lanceolatum]|uniref:zinc finger protein 335-like n=1 Tax=Branchiostoma lanceolatum TaxID=7740 RepID=UPI003455A123
MDQHVQQVIQESTGAAGETTTIIYTVDGQLIGADGQLQTGDIVHEALSRVNALEAAMMTNNSGVITGEITTALPADDNASPSSVAVTESAPTPVEVVPPKKSRRGRPRKYPVVEKKDFNYFKDYIDVVLVEMYRCRLCKFDTMMKANMTRHMHIHHNQIQKDGETTTKEDSKGEEKAEEQQQEKEKEDAKGSDDESLPDDGAVDDNDEDSDYEPERPIVIKPPEEMMMEGDRGIPPKQRFKRSAPLTRRAAKLARTEDVAPKPAESAGKAAETSSSNVTNGTESAEVQPSTSDESQTKKAGTLKTAEEEKEGKSDEKVEVSPSPVRRVRVAKLKAKWIRKMKKGYRVRKLMRPHRCRSCGMRFPTVSDLNFHQKCHDGVSTNSFKCPDCPYSCTRWSSLKEHQFHHNGQSKPYKCDKCNYSSVYKKDVTRHQSSHTTDRPFICEQCGKSFKRDIHLKSHIDTHRRKADRNSYTCEICTMVFTLKKPYMEHVREHNQQPKLSSFTCPVCGRTYTMQKRLTQHMKTHSAEKPHMCDKCGKSFKKRYTFKMHLLTHIHARVDGKYVCELCSFICDNKRVLLNHQMAHNDEKPFKCNFCKYASSKEEFLVAHEAKHTGAKPFQCTICQFSTQHQRNLKLHVKGQHPEKYFELFGKDIPKKRLGIELHKQLQQLVQQERQQQHQLMQQQQQQQIQQQQEQQLLQQQQQQLQQIQQQQYEQIQVHGQAQAVQDAVTALQVVSGEATIVEITEDPGAGTEVATAKIGQPGTTTIYEATGGESAESVAESALDLLLNMSTARDSNISAIQLPLQEGEGETRKVVTIHMDPSENIGNYEYRLQPANGGREMEVTHVALNPYAEGPVVSQQQMYAGDPTEVSHTVVVTAGDSSTDKGTQYTMGVPISQQYAVQGGHEYTEYVSEEDGQGSSTPKKFTCKQCSLSFSGRSELEIHKKAHSGGQGFKCVDCDFSTLDWLALKEHMQEHSALRPHKCDQCSFASKNKKDLKRHQMTHTNEKPFTCEACGQRFNRNCHLKFHMERIHNTQKPQQSPQPAHTSIQEASLLQAISEASTSLPHQVVYTTQQAMSTPSMATQDTMTLGHQEVVSTAEIIHHVILTTSHPQEGEGLQQLMSQQHMVTTPSTSLAQQPTTTTMHQQVHQQHYQQQGLTQQALQQQQAGLLQQDGSLQQQQATLTQQYTTQEYDTSTEVMQATSNILHNYTRY